MTSIQVEISTLEASKNFRGKKTRSTLSKNVKLQRVPLKNLGISFLGLAKKELQSFPSDNGSETLSGGDAFQAVSDPNYALYQFIYQTIDSQLTYPQEFTDAGFQGTVYAKLYFDENGKYDRSQSEFQYIDSYLKVNVIRALRKIQDNPVPKVLNKLNKPFYLNSSFHFYQTENGNKTFTQYKKLILGHQLFFYRSNARSKLQWDLGPLHGFGPIGIGLDILWFLKKGEELLSKKVKIDPLQKYRDDPEW